MTPAKPYRPCYCEALPFPHRVGSGACERDAPLTANADPDDEPYAGYNWLRERDLKAGI
jgi:hypothetical protein